MKKIIAIVIMVFLIFSLNGCDSRGGGSSGGGSSGGGESAEPETPTENTEDDNKVVPIELGDEDINQEVDDIGECFEAELSISGLETKSLGAFDLFLEYNSDVIEFVSVKLLIVFGRPDLINPDLYKADIYYELVYPGRLYVKEVSHLSTNVINVPCFQPNSFILATFTFKVISEGKSGLFIDKDKIVLSDAEGNRILLG